MTPKRNECVVCGKKSGLSRHHVIPALYRKFFPDEIKKHSYHDILLLCCECHQGYEREADKVKLELAEQYDYPVHGVGGELDPVALKVVKTAIALYRHGHVIPEPRKSFLLAILQDYKEQEEINDKDIEELANLSVYNGETWVSHGDYVVSQIDDPQEFVEMWREHFIESMQPQYLPEHWDLQRSIYKVC